MSDKEGIEDFISDLVESSNNCKEVEETYDKHNFAEVIQALNEAYRQFDRASSHSWLGYQAYVYYRDFQEPNARDRFSQEWGFTSTFSSPVSDNWKEYKPEYVKEKMLDLSEISDDNKIVEYSNKAEEVFNNEKDRVLIIAKVILEATKSETIEEYLGDIKELKSHLTQKDLISAFRPTGGFMSRDTEAVNQGVTTPPHVASNCWLLSINSYFSQVSELRKITDRMVAYLRHKYRAMTTKKAIEKGKVFIGHGRNAEWKDLSHFLSDRLKLDWDEFNRESTAGLSIKERLESMLDKASFAFLIMTAEDEHSNSTLHARENVIHEIGLFQGRLTFKRAIILLEDGCEEFSNIHGVGQIRFPKGNIRACFEDIREVLEREDLIK